MLTYTSSNFDPFLRLHAPPMSISVFAVYFWEGRIVTEAGVKWRIIARRRLPVYAARCIVCDHFAGTADDCEDIGAPGTLMYSNE